MNEDELKEISALEAYNRDLNLKTSLRPVTNLIMCPVCHGIGESISPICWPERSICHHCRGSKYIDKAGKK